MTSSWFQAEINKFEVCFYKKQFFVLSFLLGLDYRQRWFETQVICSEFLLSWAFVERKWFFWLSGLFRWIITRRSWRLKSKFSLVSTVALSRSGMFRVDGRRAWSVLFFFPSDDVVSATANRAQHTQISDGSSCSGKYFVWNRWAVNSWLEEKSF